MLELGTFALSQPWILGALTTLPVLWLLLRLTPPAPRRISFPAISLLMDLERREETPARTPWWLMLLRLLAIALLIVALAQPLLNPSTRLAASGGVLLVVDTGWAAGRDWAQRRAAGLAVVDRAARAGQPVWLLPTARPPTAEPPLLEGPLVAAEARDRLAGLEPSPWPSDRAGALEALERLPQEGSLAAWWLADGLEPLEAGQPDAVRFAETIARRGSLTVLEGGAAAAARLLLPPLPTAEGLSATVLRGGAGAAEEAAVTAFAGDGRALASATGRFEAGARALGLELRLPAALRNQVSRVVLAGEAQAGAVALVDARWRRRLVGLVSGTEAGAGHHLLSDLHYVRSALAPFAELEEGTIGTLIATRPAALVLADVGALTEPEREALGAWVRGGGVLIRFAGPQTAEHGQDDPLLPVRLRRGGRALGGALSWEEPAALAPFPAAGPLGDLTPPADIRIRRQILAEPGPDLGAVTWARLEDGTPLVTGRAEGAGWLALIHTTAAPTWSDLPLSGLFVDMLRRLVALGSLAEAGGTEAPLPALRVLDGRGQLGPPAASVMPLPAGAEVPVSPRHPPGFYGAAPDQATAHMLGRETTRLDALPPLPRHIARQAYGGLAELALMPLLLTLATLLLLLDLAITLAMRGLVPLPGGGARARAGGRPPRPAAATAALAVIALAGLAALVAAAPAAAQSDLNLFDPGFRLPAPPGGSDPLPPQPPGGRAPDDPSALAALASKGTWLAHVLTGDAELDRLAQQGLEGLATLLRQRTSVQAGGALGVDPARHELVFFPLLYWPVPDDERPLSAPAVERLNAYLRSGGTILFDTRDGRFGTGLEPGAQRLTRLAAGLDIPPLMPVPSDHVLTKAFYLLQTFPGRHGGGALWVAQPGAGADHDGVSPIIVGQSDWAAAWARGPDGRPLYPVSPGGERQRELANRFGVNLVMYTLTGNYKADQVHVDFILERLGQ